jgi:integrase
VPRRATGLTAAKVHKVRTPGRYGDGGGLYLLVRPSKEQRKGGPKAEPPPNLKFWIFRYTQAGRTREMGLGPASGRDAVPLADARIKASELHRQVRDGFDPLDERAAAEARKRAEAAKVAADAITFRDVMDRYIGAHEASWRNSKHRQQWRNTLQQYALRSIGDLPVSAVDTGAVMRVLEPLWQTKPETASRIRGRIERILDHAKARGWRDGENPARWRGHLDHLLPARSKLRAVAHHAALPYSETPGFMAALRQQEGVAARALEFTILTATRTGEAIGARWAEVDLASKVWTVPPERTKTRKEHRVPLTDRTVAILTELAKLRPDDKAHHFVFPGLRPRRPLSTMAMLKRLERMRRGDITVHGFRSTFRDWAAECTEFPNHVVEAALAHAIGDKVEAAYRRGDLFVKRRRLMEAWAKFCAQPAAVGGDVVALRG